MQPPWVVNEIYTHAFNVVKSLLLHHEIGILSQMHCNFNEKIKLYLTDAFVQPQRKYMIYDYKDIMYVDERKTKS